MATEDKPEGARRSVDDHLKRLRADIRSQADLADALARELERASQERVSPEDADEGTDFTLYIISNTLRRLGAELCVALTSADRAEYLLRTWFGPGGAESEPESAEPIETGS